MSGLTQKSGQISRVCDILNILARLKNIEVKSDDIIITAANILELIENDHQKYEVTKFIAEQLHLTAKNAKNRRYSQSLYTTTMVRDRTFPKLYQELCNSGLLILHFPSWTTLRRLRSSLI